MHTIDGGAPMLIYSADAARVISINDPHGSLPGVLRIEDRIDESVRGALAELGRKIETHTALLRG